MDVIAAGGGPAGLMTAALLDAAGVRAEACERGSEPARQSRGTAMHPRTLEVLTMIDAGDGRRISDVLLAQGRRVPGHASRRDARPARLPRPGHAVPVHADAPAVGAEHALAVYLDARGVPVRHGAEVTAAGQSADEAHVQVSGPGTPRGTWPARTARTTWCARPPASASARTARPGWPARPTPGGGTPPARPGTGCHPHRPPGLACNAQRHGHPGRELRYHRPGKRSSCPPRPTPAGPRAC
jgi:hypothetical protein